MKSITQYPLSANQYFREETNKTQLYLHHTAGNPNPFGVYDWWNSNASRIATCIVIGGRPGKSKKWKDGEIVQGFSSKYWAYHLGLKKEIFDQYKIKYTSLDRISIAVEVCNWGQLTLDQTGKFRNYVDQVVPQNEICELDVPYKGFKYYHAYTDAQIESIYELIKYWEDRYNLPFKYSDDLWKVSERALRGESGLYTHNSVRKDKVDITPQPKLVAMLKSV